MEVPYLPVKNNMRQSLMALSDHIPDASLRYSMIRILYIYTCIVVGVLIIGSLY